MENRSFDHMLGYLQMAGMDVNGMTGAETNPDDTGKPVKVFEFPPDFTAFHKPGEPLDESLDPCHDPDDVAEQIANRNTGFVQNFIAKKNPPPEHRRLPMGTSAFTGHLDDTQWRWYSHDPATLPVSLRGSVLAAQDIRGFETNHLGSAAIGPGLPRKPGPEVAIGSRRRPPRSR